MGVLRVGYAGELGVDDDDGTVALAAAQALERLRDLIELDEVRNHVVQRQPAGGGEIDQATQRQRWVRGAVVAADDPLLGEELDRRQADLDADGRKTDDDRGAAGAQRVPRQPDRRGRADHLERVVDAAARQRADLGGGIVAVGEHRVGGAAADRVLELLRAPVDGDDLSRAGQPRRRDRLHPDATAADHADALADPDPGGMVDGAESGDRTAAQQ